MNEARILEIERRLNQHEDRLRAIEARVAALEQKNQGMLVGGGSGFGGSDTSLIGRAPSNVSAASGSTYGTGTAIILYDNGTAIVDTEDTVSVKNITNKTITGGSTQRMIMVKVDSSYWVVAVYDCTTLV